MRNGNNMMISVGFQSNIILDLQKITLLIFVHMNLVHTFMKIITIKIVGYPIALQ